MLTALHPRPTRSPLPALIVAALLFSQLAVQMAHPLPLPHGRSRTG